LGENPLFLETPHRTQNSRSPMKPPKLIDQIARSWCFGSRHMQRSNVFASWRMISRHFSKPGWVMFEPLGTQRTIPINWRCALQRAMYFARDTNFWPLQAILLLAYCSKNEQLNLQRQACFAEPKEHVATKIQQISANFAFFFVQPCTFYMLFHLGPSWCYLFLLPCDPRTRQSLIVHPAPMIAMYFFSSYPRKWWLQMDDSKTHVFFLEPFWESVILGPPWISGNQQNCDTKCLNA